MKDLGIKVVQLNIRVRKLENRLGLKPIIFPPRFNSGYHNLLINTVEQLYSKVRRLERILGLITSKSSINTAMLKNVALNINALCQRIARMERIV